MGNRLIGICLGFQALTSFSEESGGHKCLGLLGRSIKTTLIDQDSQKSNTAWREFELSKSYLEANGWNPYFGRSRKKSISGRVFYNHTYGVELKDKTSIQIEDLDQYAAVVTQKNIMGIQFHPEKSQIFGKNFLEFIL